MDNGYQTISATGGSTAFKTNMSLMATTPFRHRNLDSAMNETIGSFGMTPLLKRGSVEKGSIAERSEMRKTSPRIHKQNSLPKTKTVPKAKI